MRPLKERFWEKVQKTGHSDCWVWMSSKNGRGYGTFAMNKDGHQSTKLAHRVAYELEIGPIPNGLSLDHRCRNRLCVNPAHLEPTTIRENLLRAPTTVSTLNSQKMFCPKGHALEGDNLMRYYLKKGVRQCRICHNEQTKLWLRESRRKAKLVSGVHTG